jgi:hypothetical protein
LSKVSEGRLAHQDCSLTRNRPHGFAGVACHIVVLSILCGQEK